jgi:hypothetical protein
MKEQVRKTVAEPSLREKVLDNLNTASAAADGEVVKGELKKGKRTKNNISMSNVVTGKRSKVSTQSMETTRDLDKKKTGVVRPALGDLVSVSPTIFDGEEPGSYSGDNPDRVFGIVTQVWKRKKLPDLLQIRWADNSGSSQVMMKDATVIKKKVTEATILAVMLVVGQQAQYEASDKSTWPKDFFQALVKSDWRSWIEAVKKEINSWLDFNAYTEISIEEKTPGASIVPLGELYSRKRDMSYKFRQYLMGNMLKQGKDFDETFSITISWDGIRWCASMACATSKELYGLDAVTGFLQAFEEFDLYAFVPSHGEYSSLSYEKLATLRRQLLDLVEKEGEGGLRKFAAAHKRSSRVNPKTCYRLNSSIYGAPSANHAFEQLFQGAHLKECGMTLSEVEPALYVKIQVDENDCVVEWLIAKIWTDDVRYFGTEKARKEYEVEIGKKIKVKFLGVPREFVGTEFLQDMKLDLCELKCPKYWEMAAEKFKYLFPNGFKDSS